MSFNKGVVTNLDQCILCEYVEWLNCSRKEGVGDFIDTLFILQLYNILRFVVCFNLQRYFKNDHLEQDTKQTRRFV